jgi:hypothetical protein
MEDKENGKEKGIIAGKPGDAGNHQVFIDGSIRSYIVLRTAAIGYLGMALPFVLLLGKIIFKGGGIEPSISDYYYTVMGDVFVGCMFAIASSIMAMVLYVAKKKLSKCTVHDWMDVVFWLETIAVMSFGFSWLVKGRTLFRDR